MDKCYNVSSNNFKRNFIRFFVSPLTWLFLYVKKSSRRLLKNSSEQSQRYRSIQPRDNSSSHQPVDSNEKNYSPSFSVRSRGSLSWHERD